MCESSRDAGHSGEHDGACDGSDKEGAKHSQRKEEMRKKPESAKGGPRCASVFLAKGGGEGGR